jgi:small conductance mechanosensitive channel
MEQIPEVIDTATNAVAEAAGVNAGNIIYTLINNSVTHSIIIILIAVIFDKILNRRLLKFVSRKIANRSEENAGRYKTLFSVISKIISALIAFLTVIWVIQILFNVSPASLVAATGIVGAALGLGAQSLVKDSINGFFIIIEDQFGVGDYVNIDDLEGKIHSVSLRMTCIEGFGGELMYIPNGSISKVINHSKGEKHIMLSIPVSYDEKIDTALDEMEKIGTVIKEKTGYLTGDVKVLGVDMLDQSAVNIKLMLSCESEMQFQCKRDALRIIREEMAERGMEIPYSHITVVNKG